MPRKKKAQAAEQPRKVETVEEYLARGGKITTCPPMQRSEEVTYKHTYGRPKKKKKED
mgnify:CR=1 FL=1|jgi:hypothetical protein